MAVCRPEEDTAGPGRSPAAAEGIPLPAEVVRLLRVRPEHAQGIHQGECGRKERVGVRYSA